MAEVVEFEIPARPEFLALARLISAAAAAREPVFSEDRLDDLRLAVSEACTNAMEAQQVAGAVRSATDGDADVGHVRVRCLLEGGRIEVEVHDNGGGFDLDALVAHPPAIDPRRLDYERGLGIPLIRILTDEVDFRSTPDGTAVRMVLYALSPAVPTLP
ncbi:MAG: ATP-binding protein [Acidimicrobiales bacterium]